MTVFIKKGEIINAINEIRPLKIGYSPEVNYNTYLMLTPLFKALIVSTNNGGKYALKVNDYKNGFFFEYRELNLSIKVPLTALFNVNEKTKGILGIKWASALECPSRARGLCQLEDAGLCYAVSGELQGSKKAPNYLMGMGSYYNSLLCIYYWALFNKDYNTRLTFFKYCNYYGVNTLRFNLSGDFKNLEDLKNLDILASSGLKLTGYTARDDLRPYLFNLINKHDNIILNGSNVMYNNRFKVTYSILEYFTASLYCKGGCLINGCLNCYKLKNKVITVLAHGSKVGTALNTISNRLFIIRLLNNKGIHITNKDLNPNGDLFRAVNKYFKVNDLWGEVPQAYLKVNKNGEVTFNGHNGFINYLRGVFNNE